MTSPSICVALFLVTYHYSSVHFSDSVQSVSCNCCFNEAAYRTYCAFFDKSTKIGQRTFLDMEALASVPTVAMATVTKCLPCKH